MIARCMTGLGAAVMAVALLASPFAAGCSPDRDPNAKPKGTLADPVEVCERLADVCRIDESRLGVCEKRPSGAGMFCAPQH